MDFLHEMHWVLAWRSPALTHLAQAFSWLGYSTFIIFFLALGYWSMNKAVFFRLLVLVAFNALVNAYAKDWFQDPRPPAELRIDDMVGESYGLPSGHAQLAVVLWLWLAWEIRRGWAWVLGSMIALGVMASRLYLGVHDIEDVLGGAALGGASLVLFEWLRRHAPAPRLGLQIFWTVGITGLAIWTWPAGARAPDYVPSVAGWLAAAAWGRQFEAGHWDVTPPTHWGRRILVLLLGTALFIVEQKLLKLAAPHWGLGDVSWAITKGLVSGVFVTVAVPWVLWRVRLCTAGKHPRATPEAAVVPRTP